MRHRRNNGISTELHSRSTYSTVKTITGEGIEGLELRPLAVTERRDRLGGKGEAVGDDQNDEEDVDDSADRIAVADL